MSTAIHTLYSIGFGYKQYDSNIQQVMVNNNNIITTITSSKFWSGDWSKPTGFEQRSFAHLIPTCLQLLSPSYFIYYK